MRAMVIGLVACGLAVGTHMASAGVVAHYPFDADYGDVSASGSDGTLVDVAPGGNSGITTVAAEQVFGGGALNLAADRDYVSVTSRTFSSGSPYSIAFWARKAAGDTGGAAQWDMVIGQRDTTAFFIALNDATSSGLFGLRWRSSSSAANRQADFAAPNDTNWHHHVIAANGTSNILYYLDGTLVSVASNKLTGFTYDSIGEAYTNTSDFDFNGQLDEVWVFDETLSPAAVANLHAYNDVAAPPITDVVAVLHYRFEGDYSDGSTSSNHGAASGNATLTADPALVPVESGALQLDGVDFSYVALSSTIQFTASQPWTIAFWAQRGELGAQGGMVMGERNSTDDFIWLNDNFAGLRFRSSANQTMDFTVTKDTNLHHYALVAGGSSNLTLYVDGAASQTLTNGTSFTLDTIGQAYTTSTLHYAFQGILDDIRVHRGALDAAAILALYELHAAPPTAVVSRVRVFLQGGQSNGDGRGDTAGLPTTPVNLQVPQADVDYFYRIQGGTGTLSTLRPGTSETGQFGPEVTCGRQLADLLVAESSTRVAIVKYANGGTSLDVHWTAGGDATTSGDGPDYVIFQQTVTGGLAALAAKYPGATLTVEGMTWMQGESDEAAAAAYEANLTAFIADVRATFGTNLPFVIARLSSGQTAIGASALATLRQAQEDVAAADPWTGLVDTDAFPVKVDNLHFDADGQQMLGYGFARELLYLGWLPGRFTPEELAAGDAEPGADPDGDGADNESEFIAGMDPASASSVLAARLAVAGPTVFQVSHPTAPGRRYAVESQSNLVTSAAWTVLVALEAGTGTNVTHTVTNGFPAATFRIRATLP